MGIAIITGASSGMGKEFALQLVNEPTICEFWLIGRSTERLKNTAERMKALYAGNSDKIPNCKVISLDFEKEGWQEIFSQLLQEEKPEISHLIQAAGYGIVGNLAECNGLAQTNMVRVNCETLTFISHACIPYMRAGSHMVLLGSVAAFLPQPGFAVYAASKSYVLSFGRALRHELSKKNIIVTTVCPGPVDTPFFDRAEQEGTRAWYKNLFIAKPDKVVALAIKDAKQGKAVSVYGWAMKCMRVLTKIIPHGLILKFF